MSTTITRLAGAVIALASFSWAVLDPIGWAPVSLGAWGFALGAGLVFFAGE
jgi:hypothetical protein